MRTCWDPIAGAAGARITGVHEFSESDCERFAGIDILLGVKCIGAWSSIMQEKFQYSRNIKDQILF